MGNVPNNSVNGKRFATGFPKTPKPPKCRACKGPILKDADDWRRIGGSRFHVGCRS